MITINKSKLTDKPQFSVVSYMNKKYLEKLFRDNDINAEIFDMPEIEGNPNQFPDGTYPFWYMFYETNPDGGNVEEVISVMKSNLDSEYLRELLTSQAVRNDYYDWWQDHEDEPYDNYHAWNEFDQNKQRPRYISSQDAKEWYEDAIENLRACMPSEEIPDNIVDLFTK